ncbi:MAG: PadR family transcriptional regulator [Actinomycetota bacterium]|nr:PadR family transcriptional regulator [Actinomycetota bacterium]
MLELAILGVLKEQPLHGYELKKRLADALGPLSSVSFGSLYPALKRLQAAGALEAVEPDQSGADVTGGNANVTGQDRIEDPDLSPETAPIPMTGSLGGEIAAFRARRGTTTRHPRQARQSQGRAGGSAPGSTARRAKKVYRITDRGERLFEELLAARGPSTDDERGFGLRLVFARYLPAEARLSLLERRRAQLVERLAKTRTSTRTGRERLDAYARSLAEHRTEITERDISWLDQLIAAEREGTT